MAAADSTVTATPAFIEGDRVRLVMPFLDLEKGDQLIVTRVGQQMTAADAVNSGLGYWIHSHCLELVPGSRMKVEVNGRPLKNQEAHRTSGYMQKIEGDLVTLPVHYTRYKIEPIYFIRENNLPFWMGNVIKYVTRADAKDGLQDLKKARRYLDMEISKQEGREDYASTSRG